MVVTSKKGKASLDELRDPNMAAGPVLITSRKKVGEVAGRNRLKVQVSEVTWATLHEVRGTLVAISDSHCRCKVTAYRLVPKLNRRMAWGRLHGASCVT